jgi:hypothetical protein
MIWTISARGQEIPVYTVQTLDGDEYSGFSLHNLRMFSQDTPKGIPQRKPRNYDRSGRSPLEQQRCGTPPDTMHESVHRR